jgi:uncharacterized protein YqgV (UPF0045/DUF77 family)
MKSVSAQISIYPLRRRSVGKAIDGALNALRAYDVEVETGPMSTYIVGEEIEVFSALRASFLAACSIGDTAMAMTISNACPLETDAGQTAAER